jgi:hypothetical protein
VTVPPTPDSPAAPDRTTTGETAEGLIRNAMQIAVACATVLGLEEEPAADDFARIAQLLMLALAKLDGASGPLNKQDETK